jgi:hypothetical protein
MTIIGLQRRLVEVGRIRMGEKNERGLPTRLETWKLTSRDELRLRAAAKVFGGEVVEWKDHPGQYALVTEVDSLPILLMPGQALSQHYELWSGGGCKRRCDGVQESISDGPCLCDPDSRECKPHTRLNVLLPDVAGVGAWRLDTQGYYAATELTGTVDLLEIATMRGVLLPARLRIDQRAVLREGQTKRFPVPTLDIDVRPLEMHAITQAAHEGEVADLPGGYKPVAELPPGGVDIAAGLAGADAQAEPGERKSARAAAPMGEVGDFESGEPITIVDENETPVDEPDKDVASHDQQTLLMATAREHGWKDSDRYELTGRICGAEIRSVKKVPRTKVDELLVALKQGPEILQQIQAADAERSAEDAAADADDDIPLEEPPAEPTDDTRTNDQLIGELRSYGDALSIRQQVDAAISKHTDEREWLQRQLKRLIERYEEQQKAAG